MQINWYGQSCFKISSGDTSILISPFKQEFGLTPPKGKADIVLISDFKERDRVRDASFGDGFVITGEGEYEVRGVLINGFAHGAKENEKKGTVYTIDIEGVSLCHLNNASKEEVDVLLEKIGGVDILMIPVGGPHTIGKEKIQMLDAEDAVAIVGEIEPRIVIPMCYKTPKLKLDVKGSDAFLKAMGGQSTESLEKLNIKKKDLPSDETKIITLSV